MHRLSFGKMLVKDYIKDYKHPEYEQLFTGKLISYAIMAKNLKI